jgi:sulfate adenylyltransferase subunit 2
MPTVKINNQYINVNDDRYQLNGLEIIEREIRFRTLGCYPLTAGSISKASSIKDIIGELNISTTTEREGRLIDKDNGGLEEKKINGYF